MQPTHSFCRAFGYHRDRRGFTLIELVVSLMVISVATTVLLKGYMLSTDLGNLAQQRELAASIAEGQLVQILAEPDNFLWNHENLDAQGFFRIKGDADDPEAGAKIGLPDVLLPLDASYDRQVVVFDNFRWSAFGRLTEAQSSYYEVTVNVRWKQAGKAYHVALTSAVPRSKIDPNWGGK